MFRKANKTEKREHKMEELAADGDRGWEQSVQWKQTNEWTD